MKKGKRSSPSVNQNEVLIRGPTLLEYSGGGGGGKNTKQRKNLKDIILLADYPRAMTDMVRYESVTLWVATYLP